MKRSIVNGENRGSINEILLKALQTGDKYGYEINKEIEVKSKGKYFIKEASLYSGLKRLESAGFITSYWKDGNLGIRRHYYSISEKGLEKLNNSNFSWDNSKEELMSDLFKGNENQKNEPKQMQMNIGDGTVISTTTPTQVTQSKSTNPFAYVVSENQQDMFSLLNNTNASINNENASKIDETLPKEETIKEENTIESKNEEKNIIEPTQNENVDKSANFDELKKEVQFKNSFLNNKANKNNINIFEYIQNSEQNASIIFEKNKDIKKDNYINQQNKVNDNQQIENNQILENSEVKEEIQQENFSSNFENDNKDKLKDIFKNLMVDEPEQIIEKDIEISKVEEEKADVEVEQERQKPELPRIKLDNDVNVTLQTNKSNNYNKQSANYYTPSQVSKNTPSVKQYISKAKSLNLSNKNIEEEISLHGFKIREYTKMNSRTYKTSNYYYPNILNLVLISLVGGICLLESIFGLIYANSSVFGIVTFTLGMALSLIFLGFAIIKYDKDKYKVEIKNYNFKTSLFYFVMIFIVLVIILVCINILRGMNLNNFSSFAKLLIFEILISFNLVLYPIVKVILFKSGKFNN